YLAHIVDRLERVDGIQAVEKRVGGNPVAPPIETAREISARRGLPEEPVSPFTKKDRVAGSIGDLGDAGRIAVPEHTVDGAVQRCELRAARHLGGIDHAAIKQRLGEPGARATGLAGK